LVFREEAKPMSDFLSSKDLRIHAASNWVIKNGNLLKEKKGNIPLFFRIKRLIMQWIKLKIGIFI